MSAQQTFSSVSTSGRPASPGSRSGSAVKPLRWAADAVAMMREGARVRLDYSAQSLWRVDRMIEDIRREGAPFAAVEGALRGFGAYGGEVVVRWAGGEWVESDGAYWVRTWDGRFWDPFDEARRCFAGDGSLRLLCHDAMPSG
ncbi:hypothetical protein OG889_16220 [Streptomyces sp. NBC_00481]|uniref:hypothetical protein n=1 Tax=unclassified Streptomyces TaxID=2593676 RepID=UPI002DDB4605|nr:MULTISPECIES: hypothetical protein [unclassified Streptomyces]WRY96147.1 hypothetical protein OG889_16220 [Streptomyces sp. NBC_00481]